MSAAHSKHPKPANSEAAPQETPEENARAEEVTANIPAAEDPYVAGLKREIAEKDARIADLDAQVRHYAQAYDKARTEFQAIRERTQREAERNASHAKVKLVGGLLSVLDSLDRSLESVKNQEPTQAFVGGVQLIRSQFENALSGLGMSRFDGVGEVFDPNRHQAVTSLAVTDPAQVGRVVHSVAAGVLVGDEVVRAATVVVGQGVDPGEVH